MRSLPRRLLITLVLASLAASAAAQRAGYPPEEFVERREALANGLQDGLVLLFGRTMPTIASRFRQDNDFYYFTGNEDMNAIFVMDVPTREAHLFLPTQSDRDIQSDGRNWLADPEGAAERWGFASVRPVERLGMFLARRRGSAGPQTLWVRLSERDEVSQGRGNKAQNLARRFDNPFGGPPSEDAWWATTIRQRYPYYETRDVTPTVDRLRVIKTPREIEILERNARISAAGMVRAIQITEPGRFEYELEAEATHEMVRNGVQSAGYGAIVGSGPNGNVWHYRDNGRRMPAGDMVVMDYGGSLDYLVVDITRTWPVSGAFDDLQLRAYRCALEAQKAIIAAMRPGATREQTQEIARKIYEKHGFEGSAGAGHFVGMSVHDVGDRTAPFEPGMVIAVEPIVEIVEQELHVRIEDTVLVTDDGAVVLSADVPKEVDELLALMERARASVSQAGQP